MPAAALPDDVRVLLVKALADAETGWTLGGFGALAEFRRDAGEAVVPLEDSRIGLTTPRGGLAFDASAAIVPVAYETALSGGWSHAIALCLPEEACAAHRPAIFTELGADAAALREGDADAILFDLGLALPQAAIYLRSADRHKLAILRRACGQGAFAPGSPVPALLAAGTLDLVVATPLGRLEVFAGSSARTAGAPRGFVVPGIVRLGRSHAATAPIPAGWLPCAHFHPPHPCRDGDGRVIPFRPERHASFQVLHARWGNPDHVALKRRVWRAGHTMPVATDRHGRGVVRVARMQAAIVSDLDF